MSSPEFSDIVELQRSIRGRVVIPQNAYEYEYQVKRMHSASFHNRKPLMFCLCHDTGDVVVVLKFIEKHGLQLSVRSSGHSVCGSSCKDDTVVVDVGNMRHCEYNEDTEELTLGPGATNGDVNVFLERIDRMTPTGVAPITAMGGLALHGGIGWLMHRFGTCCDNITAMIIVLADGTVKHLDHGCKDQEDRELFFAARGAAGILGIVTSFTIKTYPMEYCTGGFWIMVDDEEYSHSCTLVKKAQQMIEDQEARNDRKLFGAVLLSHVPPDPSIPEELHGKHASACFFAAWGTDEEAMAMVNEFADREIVGGEPPKVIKASRMSLLAASMFMDESVTKVGVYAKTVMANMTEENISNLCSMWAGHDMSFGQSLVGFEYHGGQVGAAHGRRINKGHENCIPSLREYLTNAVIWLYFPETGFDKARDLAREMESIFKNDLVKSCYSNYVTELSDTVGQSDSGFSDQKRLLAVKTKVDPNNLFSRRTIVLSTKRGK